LRQRGAQLALCALLRDAVARRGRGGSVVCGAVVDGETVRSRMVEAEEALRRFDSYTFLEGLGAKVMTGPTGNNLRDLRVLLGEGGELSA
jgi:glycerate-2-kinase